MPHFPAVPDYFELWRQLATFQERHWNRVRPPGDDFWAQRAQKFDAVVRKHWRPELDSSRRFVKQWLEDRPGSTAMDIGAGTGRWAEFMAPYARKVTVVEPSESMLEVLRESLSSQDIRNVEIIDRFWPLEEDPEPCDLVLASHAVYGVRELRPFIEAMERTATQVCLLLLRAPLPDGVFRTAAAQVLGQPHDSPNFELCYSALLQMGVHADVHFEDCGFWEPRSVESPEKALEELKSRLDVLDDPTHDDFLRQLVKDNLIQGEEDWRWPPDTRSALVHWDRERFSINR